MQSISTASMPPVAVTAPTFSFRSDVIGLSFSDPVLQTQFDAFRVKEVSIAAFVIILCISTLIQAYFVAEAANAEPFVEAVRIVRLASLIPGWMYIYQIATYEREGSFCQRYLGTNRILADISVNCIIISLGLNLIGRVHVGACSDGESEFNCNPEADVHALPQDSLYMLITSAIGVQALIKPRWQALFASWIFGTLSIIIALIIADATVSPLLPFTLVMTLVILYEYERNVVRTYIALQNMEQSIRTRMHAENEKRVMEMRSVEMRHLLGNVAHDLKTPMQSFVMELELLDKMFRRPLSQAKDIVSYSASETRKMLECVQGLTDTNSFMYMVINRAIDYAKNSSGHTLEPTLDTINIVDTIQWAINVVRSKSRVPIKLEPLPASICPHIITDKQWLIENILCLVSNATKFTMHGSVVVRCMLSSSMLKSMSKCDTLLIEVEDTGIGISEENKGFLFRPYQQTMRMAGGTGLGLYSMSLRMKALGGECGLRDRSDGKQGCCFWFKIPYRPDSTIPGDNVRGLQGVEMTQLSNNDDEVKTTTEPLSEASFAAESPRTPCSPRSNVLVVDDSLTIRKSINRVLMNEGLSVDLAENGQMALEMMGLKRYDLVLMDLQMPVMDGLEAVRRLRKQESESGDAYHQKVIGISAYTGEPYCSDALSAGMDAFIEKPFSAKRFFEICEQHDVPLVRSKV